MGTTKTAAQLEADQQATVKLVLGELERMMRAAPGTAEALYAYNDARHKVIRRLWTTFNDAVAWRPEAPDADA